MAPLETLAQITTPGGLISAGFIENVREVGSRQGGTRPQFFSRPVA